jgi:hypothetical protein
MFNQTVIEYWFANNITYLAEPAFMELENKDKIVSRFALIFSGLEGTDSVSKIQQNYMISQAGEVPIKEISEKFVTNQVIYEK